MIIEYLSSGGCGNAEQGRINLRKALSEAGIDPDWKEIDLDSSETPETYKQYGSPTILVNGRDIAPVEQSGCG